MSQLREMRRRIDAAKASIIEPCLPTLAAVPPGGAGWIHELKQDGYRLMAHRDGDGVRLVTRNGHDWTDRYPSIVPAVGALPCKSCVIDGEVMVCDPSGLAVFNGLRHGPRVNPDAVLFAFDLLKHDGNDLRREPIERRKAKLAELLADRKRGRKRFQAILLSEHLAGDASTVFEHACDLGCEGIVSKRLGSRYTSGRTMDWIKVKNPKAPWKRRLEEEEW